MVFVWLVRWINAKKSLNLLTIDIFNMQKNENDIKMTVRFQYIVGAS